MTAEGTATVYVMAAGDQLVKVGMARDVSRRVATIATACPFPVVLAFTLAAPAAIAPRIERRAHEILSEHRTAGEWFSCAANDAIAAVTAAQADPVPRLPRWRPPVPAYDGPPLITPDQSRAARALLDWSQDQLATKAGISAGSVRHFEKGRQTFAPKSLRALCEAFTKAGVEVFPENGGGAGVRFAKPRKSAKAKGKDK